MNHIHENNICDNLDQITNLKMIIFIQNNPQIEQNQNVNTTKNTKTIQQYVDPQRSNTPEPKIPQKERKN